MDPYKVLGVGRKAAPSAIKAAHRKLVKEHHPDKVEDSPENAERLDEIQDAYHILKDPDRRKRYDETGRSDKIAITDEVIEGQIRQAIKAVIHRHEGTRRSQLAEIEDIHKQVLAGFRTSRQTIQADMTETRKKLNKAIQLKLRFKPKGDKDFIGDVLKEEIAQLETKLRSQQDGIELSQAVEKVWLEYDYEVGPQPEGHYSREPTARELLLSGPIGANIRGRGGIRD